MVNGSDTECRYMCIRGLSWSAGGVAGVATNPKQWLNVCGYIFMMLRVMVIALEIITFSRHWIITGLFAHLSMTTIILFATILPLTSIKQRRRISSAKCITSQPFHFSPNRSLCFGWWYIVHLKCKDFQLMIIAAQQRTLSHIKSWVYVDGWPWW